MFLAACTPIGYVGESGTGKPDDFWIVPRRMTYDVLDYFVRADDLWAFTSTGGLVKKIDINQVTISLITGGQSLEIKNGNWPLYSNGVKSTGRKFIVVTHQSGMKADYSIEIVDGSDIIDPDYDDIIRIGDDDGLVKWED
jgi:hypothetical protein